MPHMQSDPTRTAIRTRLLPPGTAGNHLAVRLADSAEDAARWVADAIASALREAQAAARGLVLGLPTGGTPLPVYQHLVAEHRAGRLSCAHATCFNLDEYHGLAADHPASYHAFMRRHLFDHLDCPAERIHLPCGDLPGDAVPAHAAAYEAAIAAAGGIDLCLLGIGRNGHIAFNEPGSTRLSRTRLAWLDAGTRRDAAHAFAGEANVPRAGVTMGVATILASRRVILFAAGDAKAAAVAAAVEGAAGAHCPASWLHDHPDVVVVCDPAAAAQLTALRAPWRCGAVAWTPALVRRAVIATAQAAGKPVLALGAGEYQEHGLGDLAAAHGGVHELNLGVFRDLHATITGWPGGKPPERRRPGDIVRPRDAVHPKTVLVLSPHPDDDVIGMGGTLLRLVDHGHHVHVAHCTSGANAVPDEDVRRHRDLAVLLGGVGPDPADAAQWRRAKAAVRRAEALSAGRACGLAAERIRFLDLPFYDRRAAGGVGDPLGEDDVAILAAELDRLRPHQLYAAGDLRDPNGTHRRCFAVLRRAIQALGAPAWWRACEVFLYRGAWDAVEAHELVMTVPLAPADVERKRRAILCHRSQADGALFPGDDAREFWQRAEARCAAAAAVLDALGLPEYTAVEGFAAWSEPS